jgi:16S rRNA (uracil1498-N3)-methyltransferase
MSTSLPLFYEPGLDIDNEVYWLSTETIKHAIHVLRLKVDDRLQLTNGRGLLSEARISYQDKKKVEVALINAVQMAEPVQQICLAVSLLKNAARIEWLIEKSTEMGITQFYPLICNRTERVFFKQERWHSILVSAMLQSRQCYLPTLFDPTPAIDFFSLPLPGEKLIAHCMNEQRGAITQIGQPDRVVLAIGPEGDFTADELARAKSLGFSSVHLGQNRLRTETAALAAVIKLKSL